MSLTPTVDARPGLLRSSGVRVTYGRRIRRVTLQRVLTSKVVFHKNEVTEEELLVLYDNMIALHRLQSQDPDFNRKFGNSLEELTSILRRTKVESLTHSERLNVLSTKLRALDGFYVPMRNFPGVWKRVEGQFHVLPTQSLGIPKKLLKSKPYIGVGYKDKGTRRDPAKDGTPSWQEVAMDRRGER